MINKSKAIFGLLKRVKEFDSNSFIDRLYAQKIGYILQKGFEINLGYSFNWYIYGPYSTGLSHDLYEIKNTKDLEETVFKSEELENKFNNFLTFFNETKPDRDAIELYASILYACKDFRLSKDGIIKWVNISKPHFSESKINHAWNVLHSYNLL